MSVKKTQHSVLNDEVTLFMEQLDHPYKAQINQLRGLIKKLNPEILEEIKWNAPSFKLEEHFATFKLHPPKHIQIVLHRGVKPKNDNKQFLLTDAHGLIKWAASDRCVLTLTSAEQVMELEKEISSILRQWIEQL